MKGISIRSISQSQGKSMVKGTDYYSMGGSSGTAGSVNASWRIPLAGCAISCNDVRE
ncbi:uncharacterized protein RHIMIDRAFT_255449 [Rhizopus microsporus ATCC 52813]|uniref:Uncharacterized protein n=1 Tax=Rhizopus microsporus ATCC 52813 TaxID=1340429 RepID=A0A2G4SGL1_RHIZD|nr:uncharacterized protein RHIMIDRAFT_270617 [Rhizopus microsporus ATCC 52813]XP_023471751.1 uncharacterized protein RHIMIDRAFT_255449 [Rhizopus microsporus ATCC 52813]PHZ07908.1 hypothetical protein RHIMIDRAFT_270617 [Rhizopus microsporus ATCC 52813]PHZ18043.1 hypothetical protein RHIMIDRAFT_255449 [Rhizopus microsporus ATCC 52813]